MVPGHDVTAPRRYRFVMSGELGEESESEILEESESRWRESRDPGGGLAGQVEFCCWRDGASTAATCHNPFSISPWPWRYRRRPFCCGPGPRRWHTAATGKKCGRTPPVQFFAGTLLSKQMARGGRKAATAATAAPLIKDAARYKVGANGGAEPQHYRHDARSPPKNSAASSVCLTACDRPCLCTWRADRTVRDILAGWDVPLWPQVPIRPWRRGVACQGGALSCQRALLRAPTPSPA